MTNCIVDVVVEAFPADSSPRSSACELARKAINAARVSSGIPAEWAVGGISKISLLPVSEVTARGDVVSSAWLIQLPCPTSVMTSSHD